MRQLMPIPFKGHLDQIRTNPGEHNRWRTLTRFASKSTATAAAIELRRRGDSDGFVFRVVSDGDRHALKALYKQTGADGRVPLPAR